MPTSWRDLFERGERYGVDLSIIQDEGTTVLERVMEADEVGGADGEEEGTDGDRETGTTTGAESGNDDQGDR